MVGCDHIRRANLADSRVDDLTAIELDIGDLAYLRRDGFFQIRAHRFGITIHGIRVALRYALRGIERLAPNRRYPNPLAGANTVSGRSGQGETGNCAS